ncbi:MAG: glycoside hydrolase family 97 N-terminal domain-containing protein, partial [Flavobacteriaceae bacterium]
MKKSQVILILIITIIFFSCTDQGQNLEVSSPNKAIKIEFGLTTSGAPNYRVTHKEEVLIEKSKMGFDLKDQLPLNEGFEILNQKTSTLNETWDLPWGEQLQVNNHYNELIVELEQAQNGHKRRLNVYFRAYDDGIGFRYEFLKEQHSDSITILDENTEFQLTGDHTSWWIPGDWDIYEHLYNTSKVSEIDALAKRDHPNLAQT